MGKKRKKKSQTVGDLELLATVDEVTALAVTAKDQEAGVVPEWAELRFTIRRGTSDDIGGDFPLNVDVPLRRHDGELIIQVLHEVLHPEHGSDQLDRMWFMLDGVVDRIQKRTAKGKDTAVDVGMALGLANAIALVYNPVKPDVDAIRDIATARAEARN